jgi:hypothetical protein
MQFLLFSFDFYSSSLFPSFSFRTLAFSSPPFSSAVLFYFPSTPSLPTCFYFLKFSRSSLLCSSSSSFKFCFLFSIFFIVFHFPIVFSFSDPLRPLLLLYSSHSPLTSPLIPRLSSCTSLSPLYVNLFPLLLLLLTLSFLLHFHHHLFFYICS